jgi:hypothetical protein
VHIIKECSLQIIQNVMGIIKFGSLHYELAAVSSAAGMRNAVPSLTPNIAYAYE